MFRVLKQSLCILVGGAIAAGGCVTRLPPAAVPAPIAPNVPGGPPPASGQGRLIIDVADGPTPVQRIIMAATPVTRPNGPTTYRLTEQPTLLCPQSPCVTDVPVGNLLVGFPVIGNNELEVELVNVGPDPSVYRRTLSQYEGHPGSNVGGILLTSFGGAAAITGTVLLPVGLAKDNSGLTIAGGVSLGAGAALLTAGILWLRANAATFRPGSSNHYPLGQ